MRRVREFAFRLQWGDASHEIERGVGARGNAGSRLCQGWSSNPRRPGTASKVGSTGQRKGSSRGGTHRGIAHRLDGKEKGAVDDDAIPHALQPTASEESDDASRSSDQARNESDDKSD